MKRLVIDSDLMGRFVKVRMGDSLFRVLEDYNQPCFLEFIAEEIDNLHGAYDSNSKYARIRKTEVVLNDYTKSVFIKRFFSPNALYSIKEMMRSSKAAKAWKANMMLERYGFQCARVMLVGERRSWGRVVDSVLVTEEVRAPTVMEYASRCLGQSAAAASFRRKCRLIGALAREIARMHSLGIVHGDLLPGNILIDVDEDKPKFIFLDNDRTRKLFGGVPEKHVIRNLVQLGRFPISRITLTDRLRFFKTYMEENPRFKDRERDVMFKIVNRIRYRLIKRRPEDRRIAETFSFRALLSGKL